MNVVLQCLVILFVGLVNSTYAEKKIVCYVGTWAVYRPERGRFDIEHINPFLCTHLMYGFFGINEDGTVRIIDPYLDLEENWGRGHIKKFNALKLVNPSLKTMAAIGGWNEGSFKFSNVAAKPSLRAKFIKNCIEFCRMYNFDGVDLDWEYPAQRGGDEVKDKENHATWLEEFRKEFDREGLLLSAAVASAEFSSSKSYDIPRVVAALDFVNVMTYDMHGAWDDYCGLNAPLYEGPQDITDIQKQLNVNSSIQYWLSQGAPKEKIVMGIPLYGRSFTLSNAANHGIGAPAVGAGLAGPYSREPGVMGYNEFCEKLYSEQWDHYWSSEQHGYYAVKGNQWIGYEDPESLHDKMQYFLQMDLGGAMVWSLESDDFLGVCSSKSYPLMSIIYDAIHNGQTLPTTPSTVTATATSTITTQTPSQAECAYAGIFPNLEVCEKYYICTADGHKYEFDCPAGLVFDPVSNVCNWPQLVDCGHNVFST